MLRFTFDTNCIIDLEEKRPNSEYLNHIIDAWTRQDIGLAVVAISASENQPYGVINRSYSQFEQKLSSVGIQGTTELLPLNIWDLFYWDHFIWSNNEEVERLKVIRDILFPSFSLDPPSEENEKHIWRNKLCDILVAWCCVYHSWEVLVTSDNNFHNKKEALAELGIKQVLNPKEAAELCKP